MPKYKIDNKEAVEGIIEENLFSQPFMVEMFGTDIEYELDHDTSPDTDEARNPILKQHILVEIQASKQTIELVGAILDDFEIGIKKWLKQYGLESYFDATYTSDDYVTISIDVPEQDDPWSPEKYAAKGLEIDGSYIPRLIMGALDKLKGAQDLPASVLQEMSDKVVDEIRGAGTDNINESYVFVDFLEKLAGEVRNSIKGETIDHIKTTNDNTGLGNTLTVVDTPVIQYSEDKTYAEIDRQVKKMKMALDARAKTIKKEVYDAIDAGNESPVAYVITSAIRPKPSRAKDGKDLGKITVSFYKWGKYQGEEEIDEKDLTTMIQLGQYELDDFDIRDEDIDKTFYAEENDIDDTNDEEDGYGVKRAYAIEDGKAKNGKKVAEKISLDKFKETPPIFTVNKIIYFPENGAYKYRDDAEIWDMPLEEAYELYSSGKARVLDVEYIFVSDAWDGFMADDVPANESYADWENASKAYRKYLEESNYNQGEWQMGLYKCEPGKNCEIYTENNVQKVRNSKKVHEFDYMEALVKSVQIGKSKNFVITFEEGEFRDGGMAADGKEILIKVSGYSQIPPGIYGKENLVKPLREIDVNISQISTIKPRNEPVEEYNEKKNAEGNRESNIIHNVDYVIDFRNIPASANGGDVGESSIFITKDEYEKISPKLLIKDEAKDGKDTKDLFNEAKKRFPKTIEKLVDDNNKNVSSGYPEYKANFENALFKKYGVMIGDTGIEDSSIKEAFDKNENVDNLVNYLGEKHQITPVAAQGTAVEIKSPVKSKSATSKSYICIIKDRFGKEIGSYELDYADDDYVSTFLSAIGVRLKAGDTKEIVEA